MKKEGKGSKVAPGEFTTNFNIPWDVMDCGGGRSSSTGYGQKGSVGQVAVGYSSSSSYGLYSGFFYPEVTGVICGDINGDGGVDFGDLTYLGSYLFAGGPPPVSMWASDVNGDGVVSFGDLTYLASYLFAGGPAPNCPTISVSNPVGPEEKLLRRRVRAGKKMR